MIGVVVLKVVDYGWTAFDIYQSGIVLKNENSSQQEKMFAGLNISLAVIFEAAEPDDVTPLSLPSDDIGRNAVLKAAREAFKEGGEEGVEKYIRNTLGDNADTILNRMGINNFSDIEAFADHFMEHGAELGYKTEKEYLAGARKLVKGGKGIETFFRKSDSATLFYNKATQEFAVLNKNGTIGTYMKAERGWSYWLKQIKKKK